MKKVYEIINVAAKINNALKVTLYQLKENSVNNPFVRTRKRQPLTVIQLGEFTMVSQPIRLILVDWFVFHFIF